MYSTFRIGHHSTSDDSSAYRSTDEVTFHHKTNNPIEKFRTYLTKEGFWDEAKDEEWKKQAKKQVKVTLINMSGIVHC